jgi:hypothetical protein
MLDGPPLFLAQLCESLCLDYRARETIENEATLSISLREALTYKPNHDCVRYQGAAIHVALCFLP